MAYPIHSLFTIKIVSEGTGKESRIEIAGSMRIDWHKYLKRQSLLECLDFGDVGDVMAANTPDVTSLVVPAP